MDKKEENELKDIEMDSEKRLTKINEICNSFPRRTSKKNILRLVEFVEILSNTRLLRRINRGIKDYRDGNYCSTEEFMEGRK